MADFYKGLFKLRSNNPALRAGDATVVTYRLKTSSDENILAYLRKKDDKEVLVVLNFSSNGPLRFSINDEQVTGDFKNVFSGADKDFTNDKELEMQEWEYLVFEK